MARPTSIRRSATSKALIELRRRLGVTQQMMSEKMGCALQTVARWETTTEPQAPALSVLRDLSAEKNHTDLAATFAKALARMQRTQPVITQKAYLQQNRQTQLQMKLGEIQEIAERLKDQGSPDGQRIYDLVNDMWEIHEQIFLTNWRTK